MPTRTPAIMKGRQRGRPVTKADIQDIAIARAMLTEARSALRKAGANKAANYVQRALKSVQGALISADAQYYRARQREVQS